jgi:hypothetical protein
MRTKIRPSLILLLAAPLVFFTGCGGASEKANTASAASKSYLHEDGDNDLDDEPNSKAENDDESLFADYGTGASAADTRAIAALSKRYFSAAAAGKGASACALLIPAVAQGLAESAAQSSGHSRGSCVSSITPMFRQQHRRLVAEDVVTMTVIKVYVKGNLGLAELGFRKTPEQELIVEREGGTWKVDAPLSVDLT